MLGLELYLPSVRKLFVFAVGFYLERHLSVVLSAKVTDTWMLVFPAEVS